VWSIWHQYRRVEEALSGAIGPHPLDAWRTDALASGLLATVAVVFLLALTLFLARKVGVEARLHDVETLHQKIIEQAMDAIITVDESHRIVAFNKAAEEVFGLPASRAIGQPLNMLLPERFHAAHTAHVDRFAATGATARRMGERRALFGRRTNGEEFPLDASISRSPGLRGQLFTVILRDITRQVEAEQEVRKSHQELELLARSANEALEAQRRRVARELHDEFGGVLTALKMDIAMCDEKMPPERADLRAHLEQMRQLVDGMVAASRRLSSELRPLMLDDLGLGAALDWLAQDFAKRHRIAVQLRADPALSHLREPYASAVFRIVQEALTNVARHAQAARVDIEAQVAGGELRLEVRDDGLGIAPERQGASGTHGLLGIRERARLLAGSATIEPAPGGGTRVRARFPLPREAVPAEAQRTGQPA
jgi:PAS domain S-box-containing protein